MILDLVGFISTHFQPKPSHGDPFQAKFWPNCQPYILIRTRFWGFLMIWTWFSGFLMILTNPKRCGTSVRSFSTHFRAEISVMCQKTKVYVLWERHIFFTLKPGSDAPAGCLRRTPHQKSALFRIHAVGQQSSTLAGRIRTRAQRGIVHRRWHDGVDVANYL